MSKYTGQIIGQGLAELGSAIISTLKEKRDKKEAESALQEYLKNRYKYSGDINDPRAGEITGINPEATARFLNFAKDNPYLGGASTVVQETYGDYERQQKAKEKKELFDYQEKHKDDNALAAIKVDVDKANRAAVRKSIEDITSGKTRIKKDAKIPMLFGTINPSQDELIQQVSRQAADPNAFFSPDVSSAFTASLESAKVPKPIFKTNVNTGAVEIWEDGVWKPTKLESGENAIFGKVHSGRRGLTKLSPLQRMTLIADAKVYADQNAAYDEFNPEANKRSWHQAYNSYLQQALSTTVKNYKTKKAEDY